MGGCGIGSRGLNHRLCHGWFGHLHRCFRGRSCLRLSSGQSGRSRLGARHSSDHRGIVGHRRIPWPHQQRDDAYCDQAGSRKRGAQPRHPPGLTHVPSVGRRNSRAHRRGNCEHRQRAHEASHHLEGRELLAARSARFQVSLQTHGRDRRQAPVNAFVEQRKSLKACEGGLEVECQPCADTPAQVRRNRRGV